jgi:type IV fimbrial biogenesis protein FimT
MVRRVSSDGFTLIELMVTLSVLAIIAALALPSFKNFTERSALRGVADNVIGVIAAAKEEAIKRDQLVKVDVRTVGSGFCIGAVVVASAATAGCDCSTASNCPVAAFPTSASQLHSVQLDSTPIFGTGTTDFVIDPKTGMLSDPADQGQLDLKVPSGSKVRISLNALGRPSLCTPSGATALSAVAAC